MNCIQILENDYKKSKIFETVNSVLTLTKCIETNDESEECYQKFRLELNSYLDALTQAFLVFHINGNDFSQLSHKIAISQKLMESTKAFSLNEMNERIELHLNELKLLLDDIQSKLINAKAQMKSESDLKQMETKINFYDEKRSAFYSSIEIKENELKSIGFTSKLKCETITEMKTKNRYLCNDLQSIKEKINFYDFQPNEDSLKQKIAEMKLEFEELNHKFQ
jgi:hypothetical protein